MPTKRGKRIVDVRTQSVADGVGSVPLSVAFGIPTELPKATTTATTLMAPRGRRMTVSGVEEIEISPPAMDGSGSALRSAAAHFKVPAEVLQRMQQLGQSTSSTRASRTDATALAAPSTSDASVRASAPVPALPTSSSNRDSPQRHIRGGEASRNTTAASSASPLQPLGSSTAKLQIVAAPREALPNTGEAMSEAAISETVAAHKTSRSGTAQDDGEVPLRVSRPPKPMVFSRQWRRQLFAGVATTNSSELSGSSKPLTGSTVEDVLRSHRQSKGLGEGGGVSGSGADAEDDDEDGISPFGNATVIKFDRAEDRDDVTGRRAAVPASSDSGGTGDQCSAEFSSMMQATCGESSSGHQGGLAVQSGGLLTRQQRHQRLQQVQEAREHHRVRRHMTGFDPDFLSRQEAQLQLHRERVSSEEDEDEESGEYSSEGEEGASHCSVSSTVESEVVSTVSRVEGREETVGEGGEGSDHDLSESSSAPAPCEDRSPTSSSGFRAAERTEHARHEQLSHDRSRATAVGTAAAAAALPLVNVPGNNNNSSGGGSTTSPSSARSLFFKSFFFACHENPTHRGGCHHTLVGLRDAVTIKGPCGIVGFGLGEVSVSGFYLGRKQLTLWHEEHRAVLMPMKRLKTRHAQDMELPQWPHLPALAWPPKGSPTVATAGASSTRAVGDALGPPLNPLHYRRVCTASGNTNPATASGGPASAATEGPDDEEEFLQSLQWNCESVFGEVDWDWVEATVQSWRSLFSNHPQPIVLILQPPSSMRQYGNEGPTRRFYFNRKRNRQDDVSATAANAYMDIPSFVAHRSEPSVDVGLVPSIVPSIAAQGCGSVMVLGSVNIGKSTLCRYLANVLLSQHGLCYWLDLDIGQPEFGVPGQMTLSVVRRPLLRPHDASCAQMVAAFFLGGNTPSHCPLTTANALAAICAQALTVSKMHPVVVNTHGWVLQTGRRVSVEALRRLLPRQVIHLYRAQEELWAQNTAALLDPCNGLNAEVVQRRFLVRRSDASATAAAAGSERSSALGGGSRRKSALKGAPSSALAPPPVFLCRLPYPHAPEDAIQQSASSHQKSSASSHATTSLQTWRGQVHSVCVQREETYSSMAHIKATKGSRGRQRRWEAYFSALLRHYAGGSAAGAKAPRKDQNTDEEAETTLLEAPLSALHSIVLAERDEKLGDVYLADPAPPSLSPSPGTTSSAAAAADEQRQRQQTHAEVAAALEHAVVAVLFHARPSTVATCGQSGGGRGGMVRSLASLQNGFPVSCYGVVESSERELLHGADAAPHGNGTGVLSGGAASNGWIRIRVPLRPSIVAAMLSTPEAGLSGEASNFFSSVSIAYSAALRSDTSFVDVWR
ncbi:hypothetical protein JKF63_06423 [Porcisia hertigi]|uniref:Clp1 P-loop domain-containing protein n=1 Tax=Porcisia hertigi TaxID=2761500 RepID=A0A836LJX5_9TRYP|nr:hypothetical protein JKF63_06423 [Porcisia hertigi]